MLFSKTLADGAILSPICVSNSVIVIETRGTVRKYSLNGTEIFSTNSLKSGEICTHAGRWDYRTVYMTAVRYTGEGERRSIEARLVWIDVNGIVPVTKWEKEIFLPLKITRVRDDAVILGNERMERISPPKELRTFLD
jgi:hypothetical protein